MILELDEIAILAKEGLDSAKSAHKRITEVAAEVADIHKLAEAMASTRQEVEGLKEDITEIKDTVSGIAAKPSKYWENILMVGITAIVTAIVSPGIFSGGKAMTFEVVIIVFAVLAVIAVAGWVLAYVKSKGVNVQGGVDTAQKVIGVADTVTDALAAVAPNTVTTTLQKIVDGAKLAVDSAEQMYLNGNVTADQRKETATNVLKQALALDGIAYEGDVSALGDAAMEAAVRALPSTGEALAAKAGTAKAGTAQVSATTVKA